MHEKQECNDHYLWHKNLTIAFWILLAIAWYFILFTDYFIQMGVFIIMSLLLILARIQLDRRHYEWHLRQERDDSDE